MVLKTKTKVLIYTLFTFTILSINFTNYSVLADGVIPDLGLTYTQSGLILSITAIFYAAVQIPSGIFNDRFGGIRGLVVSYSFMVIAGMMFAAANSYEMILLSRIILGLGTGPTLTACIKLLSANYMPEELDRATGIFGSGWGVGFIVILVVIPVVMVASTWRGGLYLTVVLTAIVFAVMPLFLRGASTGAGGGSRVMKKEPRRAKSKIISRNLIACVIINFTAVSVSTGTMTWAALYLQDKYQITIIVAGLSAAVIGITNVLGSFVSGMAAEKFGRRVVIMATMAGCVITPILFIPSHFLLLDMAIIASIGWFGMFFYGPVAAIVTTSVEQKRVGFTMGFFNTLGFTGTFFAPLVFGYVLDITGEFNMGFLILGLTALAGIVGGLMIKFEPRSRKIENNNIDKS